MLVSDVPQQKRNVDCTFERCVRQTTKKSNSGCYLIKTGKYKTELARRKLWKVAKNELRNIIKFVSFIFAQAML